MAIAVNAATSTPAAALDVANPKKLSWSDAPPALPKGAKQAVLHGDPSKPGPFVLRVRVPAGYKVPLHWHSQPESLTVLSGTLVLGTGDHGQHAHVIQAGGFHYVAAKLPHTAYAKTAAEFQVHGEGPFDIQYIHARDDPQSMARH